MINSSLRLPNKCISLFFFLSFLWECCNPLGCKQPASLRSCYTYKYRHCNDVKPYSQVSCAPWPLGKVLPFYLSVQVHSDSVVIQSYLTFFMWCFLNFSFVFPHLDNSFRFSLTLPDQIKCIILNKTLSDFYTLAQSKDVTSDFQVLRIGNIATQLCNEQELAHVYISKWTYSIKHAPSQMKTVLRHTLFSCLYSCLQLLQTVLINQFIVRSNSSRNHIKYCLTSLL